MRGIGILGPTRPRPAGVGTCVVLSFAVVPPSGRGVLALVVLARLLAREAMKDLDRHLGPKSYAKRKSMIALEESGDFKFVEFLRDYFERLAGYIAAMGRDEDVP